jgi:hypothetical protein
MDRVDVFSKNAAVRNALWWDKLYHSFWVGHLRLCLGVLQSSDEKSLKLLGNLGL